MDDWDAFDPDLHAALNASLTPPATDDQMQPVGSAHPAGSETTVQSAQQVHAPQGQPQATSIQQSVHAGTSLFTGIPQGIPMFPSVHQAQSSA